jgi:hypothetical protein
LRGRAARPADASAGSGANRACGRGPGCCSLRSGHGERGRLEPARGSQPEPPEATESLETDEPAESVGTAEPSEPERPDWRRRGKVIGIGLLAAALVAAPLVWWSQWERWTTCTDAPDHVVDEESGLCYTHPLDWVEMSEGELEGSLDTSGLRPPEDHFTWVDVAPVEHYVLGSTESIADDELEGLARVLATLSPAMSEGDPAIESESLSINGHAAGTATARMPYSRAGSQAGPGSVMWVRATVVDVEDGTSVMITTAVVGVDEADAEGGTIAILNDVHDSIAVR